MDRFEFVAMLKKEQRDLRQEYERLEQRYQTIEQQLDLLSEQHARAIQMAAALKKVSRLAISSRRQQIEALLAFLDGDANHK